MVQRRLLMATLWALVTFLGARSPAMAQGLILTLPIDGSWSRFRVTSQEDISFLRDPKEFPDSWQAMLATIPDFAHAEMELVISSVGSDDIDGEQYRWIELLWKKGSVAEEEKETSEGEETLLRLQVAEKVLSNGGDPLDNARVVIVRGGFSKEDDGEIKNEERKKYELQCFRRFFPKYTLNENDRDHVRGVEDLTTQHRQVERAHRFRFHYQGKMYGGEHGSLIHHANYTVISDPTAPFGVKHIWVTDGVTIEDSGPYDPTNKFCDGPGIVARGNSQIVLLESGTNAVARWKADAER